MESESVESPAQDLGDQPPPDSLGPVASVRTACKHLDCCKSFLYEDVIGSGEVDVFSIGKRGVRLRVTGSRGLDGWLERRRVADTTEPSQLLAGRAKKASDAARSKTVSA